MTHPGLAYASVFMLAFSESVPVLGAVIPGTIAIMAISALVPGGAVTLWPLLAAAIAGAIVGDGLPYWLGHRYRTSILNIWPLNRYPAVVEQSRSFLNNHGGKSILLARFTPALRSFVPIMAGIMGMPPARFYFANILSALVWAPVHIVPGLLVGVSLAQAGAASGKLGLLLVLLVTLIWLLYWMLKEMLAAASLVFDSAQKRLGKMLTLSNSGLAKRLGHLVGENQGEFGILLLSAATVLGCAWLFFGLAEDILSGDPLIRVDAIVFRALQHLRTPIADDVMIAITELGDTVVTVNVTAVVLLYLLATRAWRAASYWLAAIVFAAVTNTLTKLAVHRLRPAEIDYPGATGFSFPSGHATVNVVLYLFLAFLLTRRIKPFWRLPVYGVAASFAFLISFSRIYLGVHWLSDVLGSLAFALAWCIVLAFSYRSRAGSERMEPGKLALVATMALILIGGLNIFNNHGFDVQRYALQESPPQVSFAKWWQGQWESQPPVRIDIFGQEQEPLNFQWAGGISELEAKLRPLGWIEAPSWHVFSALSWLATSRPDELPVIPAIEAGRLPELTYIRLNPADAHARLVLRVWPAETNLQDKQALPLRLGSVVEEKISQPFGMISIVSVKAEDAGPLEVAATAFGGGKLVRRSVEVSGQKNRVLLAAQFDSLVEGP